MRLNAYAKINLGLDVTGKRDDGYHEVCMIMQTIDVHDELVIERIPEKKILIRTNAADLPVNEDNLIYKAAKLMMDEYDLPGGISVDLTKNIPVAAGLAGGSTDAAAVIKAVNVLFDLGLDLNDLQKIGVRIGADVPYCLLGGTALAEGIGEILTPLKDCPQWRVLIAKPPVGVSTAHVYKKFDSSTATHPDIDLIKNGIEKGDFDTVALNMRNVLETVTAPEIPDIGRIEKIMKESGGYPMMSGSGPTVFGLFKSDEEINKAYDGLKTEDYVSDLFITRIIGREDG